MLTFQKFLEEITTLKHQVGSDTTQIAGTTGSYRKAALKLKEFIKSETPRILDYGAGLGLGTEEIRDVFTGRVDGYEPSPGRSRVSPTFIDAEEMRNEKYDGIICLNVLNVLEPELREMVVKHIKQLLNPGGYALIGVRKWLDDVNRAKNFRESEEEKAIWIKKGEQEVYQKGFDGDELEKYLSGISGESLTIKRVPGIAGNSVLVQKK